MRAFYLLLFTILLFTTTRVWSQSSEEISPCGMNQMTDKYFEEHPEMKSVIEANRNELENFTQQYIASKSVDEDTLFIPVVFHVIHMNGPENVSRELLYQTIERINIDYMALNSNIDQIDPDFQDLIPETFIQFKLATKDPDGNCTSGITRTFSGETNGGNQPNLGLLIQWPRNRYMNIYVVRDIGDASSGGIIAGYTYRPPFLNNNPIYDGIVLNYQFLGLNTATLTHEIGHWFNLLHVWGNSNNPTLPNNCNEDDFVADTPLCIGDQFTCNLASESCGSHDNVQNYMNYSSCSAENFTQGQSDRMRSTLNSSVAQRNNLWTASNLALTGLDVVPSLCNAEFYVEKELYCNDEEIQFFDDSYNGEVTSWEWTFEGGTPATSDEKNPLVTFTDGGYHNVSLTVSDGENEFTTVKTDFINVLPAGASIPYSEVFEEVSQIPNDDWFVLSGNDTRWEITTEAAAVGAKSVYLHNRVQTDGEKDELISSTVDLSGITEAQFTFKFAFAKKTDNDNDKLQVLATFNCGDKWNVRKTLKANTGSLVTGPNQFSEFVPTTDEWGEVTVPISSLYYIDNFRYKFVFTNGGGNNVYIDDIKIIDPTVTGINEVNKAVLNYQVYPNPVSNQLNIEFNLLEKTNILGEIFDISGRKVKTLFSNDYSLGTHRLNFDTSELNSGVYFVKITLEGESFTERVIKN